MPSRRDQIVMSDEELRGFLDEQKVMQVATVSPSGRPHMAPLWFVPGGTELRGWTYAKSQKARNLERDPRATIGIEDGVEYQELRGVMFECDVEIERETDRVAEFGLALVGPLRRRGARGQGDVPRAGQEARGPYRSARPAS